MPNVHVRAARSAAIVGVAAAAAQINNNNTELYKKPGTLRTKTLPPEPSGVQFYELIVRKAPKSKKYFCRFP
jgi:hypothetical protein